MTTLLLHEMSRADVDWLKTVGQIQELPPNQILIQPDRPCQQVHLLLHGAITVALLEADSADLKEFAQLSKGDVVGAIPGLEPFLSAATLQAKTSCWIVSVDANQLTDKLTQDVTFAAHFYRVQALLIRQRLQAIVSQMQMNPAVLYELNIKDTSSLFIELQDSDLDWFVAVGQLQSLTSGTLLQAAYRPLEALYIVLEGALSLGAMPGNGDVLTQLFLPSDTQASVQELARLGRSDVFGEMLYVQSSPGTAPSQAVQVQAVRDTEVLAIPRWRLLSKLWHDPGFALRFYRVLAVLMAAKYQTIATQVGLIPEAETQGFGDRFLSQMAMAEARFEWMVQRIQLQSATGREIKW